MGGSGDLDFIGQIFRQAPLVLFAPFVFGALYIASMVIVFRRAAERRRRAREARALGLTETTGNMGTTGTPRAFKVQPGQLAQAVRPAPPAASALPEPDLSLLTMGVASKPRPAMPSSPSAPAVAPQRTRPIEQPMKPQTGQSLLPDDLPPYSPAQGANAMNTLDALDAIIEVTESDMVDELADAVEVMRIWRDVNDGSLIIQMGSQRYRSGDAIRNPDLLRRFSAVVRDLSNMIGAQGAPSVPPPPQAARLPADSGGIGSLRAAPSETESKKPVGLRKLVQQVSGPAKSTPDKPAGIAEAVEEFLQYKLLSTPEFTTRSIHIRPGHDHGLRIEVDGHFYDSIAEVVDPDVREFLFSMMREWEARQ